MFFTSFIIATVIFWYRFVSTRDRYEEGDELIIDDVIVTRKAYKKPDQTIKFTSIGEIKEEKGGIKLINKHFFSLSVSVPDSFERFDEIKNVIADKINTAQSGVHA